MVIAIFIYIKNKTDDPFFKFKTKQIKLQMNIMQSDALVSRIHARM